MSDDRLREDPRPEEWSKWQGAVLLRDQIKYYCKDVNPPLIYPFDETCLKPASYHLRLGGEYRVGAKFKCLSDEESRLEIRPHGLATVTTLEKVNVPGFLIGRWNLKVKKVYEGLVWVGGAQVDPGYSGYLFCPLYNLSSKTVVLRYREPLFTIDFVRTTRYDEAKGCTLWQAPRSTLTLKTLDTDVVMSAPEKQFGDMDRTVNKMREEVTGFGTRIDTFQSIIFTILGIIVAAVAFVGLAGLLPWEEELNGWQIAICVVTLFSIAMLAFVLAFATIKTVLCKRTKSESNSSKDSDK